jgi:gluconate 2-dehydrogenase gamma chain
MSKTNRRRFIKTVGLATGSLLFIPACIRELASYSFFTEEEADCIVAICEQLIPKDESPGATDAGVVYYIDRQLAEVFHYDQDTYRNGIKNLQALCMENYKTNFESLSPDIQVKLLNAMESNQISEDKWPKGKPSDFFNLVLSHAMQGFYGSPIHGGNKNHISFKMLKLAYPLQ